MCHLLKNREGQGRYLKKTQIELLAWKPHVGDEKSTDGINGKLDNAKEDQLLWRYYPKWNRKKNHKN